MKKITLCLIIMLVLSSMAYSDVKVVRSFEGSFQAGGNLTVVLDIQVSGTGPTGLIVEESLPLGWAFVSSNPLPDKHDSKLVSWLLRNQSGIGSQQIRYTVSVPNFADGSEFFDGSIKYIFKGNEIIHDITGSASPGTNPGYTTPTPYIQPTPNGQYSTIQVFRNLPDTYTANGNLTVTFDIQVTGRGPNGLIIEETIPMGWSFVSSERDPDVIEGQTIKWLLNYKTGITSQQFQYTVGTSGTSAGMKSFSGVFKYVLDVNQKRTISIMGDSEVAPSGSLPQDPTDTPTPLQTPEPSADITVMRDLPDSFIANGSIVVILQVQVQGEGPSGLIVEENIPAGLSLVQSSPQFDAQEGQTVKWLLRNQSGISSQAISYELEVPANAPPSYSFNGNFKYTTGKYNFTLPIQGDLSINSFGQIQPTPTIGIPTPTIGIPSPTLTPVSNNLQPDHLNTFDLASMVENKIEEINGTFANLQHAQTTLTTEFPPDHENLGVHGNVLMVNVKPGQGTLIQDKHPLYVGSKKVLMRVLVCCTNVSAKLYAGVFGTNSEGVLTGVDISMQQTLQADHYVNRWKWITVVHEPYSEHVIPFIQIVGGGFQSDVYIDNFEMYIIDNDTMYPGSLFVGEN